MCGLFGGMSKSLTDGEISIIVQLGIVSALRGTDSTGVCIGTKQKGRQNYYVHKDTLSSAEFLNFNPVAKNLEKSNAFLVMGHCRYATSGAVSVDNAHPFKYDHIVGCHNGTIPDLRDWKSDRSDSSILIEKIAEQGIKKPLQDVKKGSYALSLVDTKTNKLYFTRNIERPLWFMTNSSETSIFWASEKDMLDFIRVRVGTARFKDPFTITSHSLLSFDLSAKSGNIKAEIEQEATKPQVEKSFLPSTGGSALIPFVKEKSHSHTTQGTSAFSALKAKDDKTASLPPWDASDWEKALAEHDAEVEAEKASIRDAKKRKKDADGEVYYKGYNGIFFGLQFAEKALERGCANCGTVNEAHDKSHWFSKTDYFCQDCLDSDFVTQLSPQVFPSSLEKKHIQVK